MRSLRQRSGESPGHRWQAFFAAPDPRLGQHIVGDYQGWQEWSERPVFRPQLPVVMVPIILNLGPLWEIGAPDVAWGAPRPFDSFVAGLHDGLATTAMGGEAVCLQVNLTPLGAHRLLGRPMADLCNRVVAFEDLLGVAGAELVHRLRAAPDWGSRFSLVDHFLLHRLAGGAAMGEITFALGRLSASHGRIRIGALAGAMGVSHKRLIARFRAEVGLPPKTIARLYRFNRMLDLLGQGRAIGLAELAAGAGYYDQAHFNRDFRDFARTTPGEYLAALPGRPSVQ